jgi:hypothetical protein
MIFDIMLSLRKSGYVQHNLSMQQFFASDAILHSMLAAVFGDILG